MLALHRGAAHVPGIDAGGAVSVPAEAPVSAPATTDVLLEARGVTKHFPVRKGSPQAHGRAAPGGRRRRPRRLPRRDGRARRRVRLRQVDARPNAAAAHRADRGNRPLRGRGRHAASARASLKAARRHMQIVFQDSVGSLDPRMTVRQLVGEGLKIHGLGNKAARDAAVLEMLERVGLAARGRRPLPAPVLRRPAPAHRPRALARPAAEVHRRGRAGLGARRVDPVAGAEPPRRAEARVRPHVPLRRPRPRRRRLHLRPDRGHVPREDRRAVDGRGPLRPAAPPLHAGAALGEPGARSRAASSGASSSPATCRARSTRPPAAASARAARSRSRSAPRSSRRSPSTAARHLAACHFAGTSIADGSARARRVVSERPSAPRHEVRLLHDQRVPMRDGITLSADVYLPLGANGLPTIVQWTPYESTRERFVSWGVWFAQRGYAAVVVDVRGRYESERDVHGLGARRPRRARHADLGRRRAVVERPHRDVGTELRRPRPVAARAPRPPEPRSASRRR